MPGTVAQLAPVKLLILIYFYELMAYYNRTYCWPTRATMVRAIHKRTGRIYSLSWIDECLHWLNEGKYIKSYFQPGHKDDGTWFNRPSNRQISRRGLHAIVRVGIKPVQFLWRAAKKLRTPKDPTPITQQKSPDVWDIRPKGDKENPFLDPERRKRLGLKTNLQVDPEKTKRRK